MEKGIKSTYGIKLDNQLIRKEGDFPKLFE
jgi:hypothetical protein